MIRTVLNVLGWAASLSVITTYFTWTVFGKPARWFHAANALGGLPLLAINILVGAWQIIPITLTFTAVGWIGLLERKPKVEPLAVTVNPAAWAGVRLVTSDLVPPGTAYLLDERNLVVGPEAEAIIRDSLGEDNPRFWLP